MLGHPAHPISFFHLELIRPPPHSNSCSSADEDAAAACDGDDGGDYHDDTDDDLSDNKYWREGRRTGGENRRPQVGAI